MNVTFSWHVPHVVRLFASVAVASRGTVLWLLLFLGCLPLCGQDTAAVVVPNTLATQDVAFGSGTLGATGYRVQEVYGSQLFPTNGMIISELRFRPDYFYGLAFSTTVSNIQFNLSTTAKIEGGLNNTFTNNSGTDETVVFSGALAISSQFTGPTNGPKDFDIAVPLTTPFLYNPAAGNLLLDIRNYSGSTASTVSGQGVAGDGASRLSGKLTALTGRADTGVDALQIVYTPTNVPPPPPPPPPPGPLTLLLRGPYIQSLTTSNVVLRWRTQIAGESRAHFGLTTNNLAWEALDAGQTIDHSVTLTNLRPNTKYFYSVGTISTNLAMGADCFFFTAPTTAKPTRIWAIGDCGTATQGDYGQAGVRNAYRAYAGKQYTDVWLMLGDNAYNSGLDTEYQTAVFNMYSQQLRSFPLWSTIGNHDAVSAAYFDIFTLPTRGEGGGIASGTELYYSFDYGNIHFVCLDSEMSSPAGPMATWLQQDLAANTHDWLIAFWHEPPYSKGSHDSDTTSRMTDLRQYINPILESYSVDVVLCGHSHNYERTPLINGHYGFSSSLLPSMILDSGSGRLEETGAYLKSDTGPAANQGAVYVVAGTSGWVTPSPINHPAHFADPAWGGTHGLNALGSMVIDVNGNRLDAKFLRETGAIDDHFTIIKGTLGPAPLRVASLFMGNAGTVAVQWKSIAGRSYRIEIATGLDNPTWTPVSPVVTATGATSRWSGPIEHAEKCFFRVSDVPQ